MEDIQKTPPPRIADAPFNDLGGDIILRSDGDNGVNFYTYKLFLIHASPIFKDMFALPQGELQTQNPGPPVVTMQETAGELRTLLLLCHPGLVPERPASMEQLYQSYRIADKYLLDMTWVKVCLPVFVDQAPVGVYLLARKHGWKEEARLAAERSLSRSLPQLVMERYDPLVPSITAQSLHDLLRYHQRCTDVLTQFFNPDGWVEDWCRGWYDPDSDMPTFLVSEEECCCSENVRFDVPQWLHTRSWWNAFMLDYSNALAKVPAVDKVPLPDILSKVSATASKCPRCGPVALEELSSFVYWVKQRASTDLEHVRVSCSAFNSMQYSYTSIGARACGLVVDRLNHSRKHCNPTSRHSSDVPTVSNL